MSKWIDFSLDERKAMIQGVVEVLECQATILCKLHQQYTNP